MAKGKTGTKGLKAAPRAGTGKAISQKLGSGHHAGMSGVDLKSKLEKAATVPYKGHDQGPGVKHGASGLLASKGGTKNLKVPSP